jgi:hypothetical protein
MRNITRRSAINTMAGAAGLSAIPVAASAMVPDPIFAAIERHKLAAGAFEAACLRTDDVAAEEEGRQVTQEDEDAYELATEADKIAMMALLSTVPTTRAGARVAIEYVCSIDWHGEQISAFAASLLKSQLLDDKADGSP